MLEDQVAFLLQRFLGNYVSGLSKEALKISVWNGDVELTNMQLKPEALNALKLPVKVKAGFLGSVKLQVPWSRLGQDPVLVYLDRIFLLAEPATHVEGYSEDAVQEAKKSRVREMEMKLLERARQLKSEVNKSWLGSLINTIIGNLKLSISNIHVRYEDLESNPGHPFAAGVTLGKLSAVTVDGSGAETFLTGGALDHIQKSVELDQLSIYLDSDISPWYVDKPWEELLPPEWVQVFRFGTKDGKPADTIVKKHSYVLQPVSGNAKYSKLRPDELANSGQPLQKAVVNLDDVTLCLSKDGYSNVLKLADNFAAFNQRLKYAHYRPFVSLKSDPRAWWKYAYKAVSDQMKKASGKLSWEQVLRFTRLRKRYISLYASLLKSDPNRAVIDNNKEIEELDRELDIELILQWRMLAHKVVERSTESDLYQQKAKKSWWSFGWNTQSFKDESEQFHLNDDDWKKLNKIIGYKEGDDEQSSIMNERKDILHMYLEVHMKHNASRLVSGAEECLADLSCDDLDCSIKLYPESKIFDMKLGSYRLSSPNGLLAESATSYDSLIAIFRYKPFDAKVDWSMVAKASPCYMTYLKDSIDDIVKFFETNDGVSQTVALETAAAVQMTIDGVKRSAQQQVNRALKDHARFLLDLDIAAPKITIPTEFHPDNVHSTKLLLDLGNLVIHSKDDYGRSASPELDMYMQFDLILSDVSAFLVDGDYNWSQPSLPESSSSVDIRKTSLLPVVDKCGVIVRLQQIRLENPLYPSTRLAVRLPSLGFHFSPARYHRLMQVAKVFQDRSDDSSFVHPWDRADFEGWISLLIRKGMGNREASWQQRYLYLVGPYLYILESPGSKSYKQYLSLLGKQISLLPADMVGGVNNVIAICDGTRPINKVVEDVNALILQCESEESRRTWQNLLQAAIYRASGSAPITGLSETSSDTEGSETDKESNEAQEILKIEQLFITGILDELKLCFNYSHQTGRNFLKVLLEEESPLFEFRAIGGQVELSIRDNDMFIGTILKSLEIEDLVCCTSISKPCFLARSYIQGFDASNNMSRNKSFDQSNFTFTEDDQFYEAPESLADSESLTSQSLLLLENPSLRTSDFSRVAGLLPGDGNELAKEKVELTDTLNSFIKAQIVKYDQNSSLYRNVDMEVTVTLATLSFFGRRPTIRAILEFVNAINIEEERESFSDSSSTAMVKHDVSKEGISDEQNLKSTEEPVIKGLLGKGKSRIIFNLVLKMARAQILFMNENETTLATLSQDNLLAEIKVFPNSFSIKAALGNLRISDDSLPDTHAYFWICDMRNPGGSSFVELIFTSFSADDEDYEGFDYSLVGELSEVRLVYLNRFIQEVVGYFMGLIPSSSEGVVKLKDQVTNSEKWFTTSEIAGSPALKLDLSLRKPIILMPRRTDSPDYLKLDVVHITVENTFQWIYGSKEEMNAVHMEMLTVKVEDINLNVGSGSELSESIIKDVKGVSIVIQRSLRDLLHQIPSVEASVTIEALKAALSNKEYQIITECAVSNVSENPNVVPPLNYGSELHSDNVEEPSIAQDLVSPESDTLHTESWISIKVAVMINLVELCLHAGVARDASLATLQISGAWLLYKSTNLGDGFLSATLKGFSVIDDREGTDEEFRLAIGNREKIDYGHLESQSVGDGRQIADKNAKTEDDIKPTPTMLILDAKFSQSTVISLCVQRPQLLVALDFLLAVAEFFVPTIGDVLSNGENNGPINVFDAIVLHESVFSQPSAEFSLSPLKPLIIDDERFEHFVYDGKGGTLCLKDREGNDLSEPSKEPIIYVESRKKLQFKDVIVKNGMYLDSCISLGSDSAYSASEDDRVYLKGAEAVTSMDSPTERNDQMPSHGNAGARSTEFIIELQAIGPELTFYNATRDVEVSYMLSNKLLHAQLDVFARLVLMGDTVELTANALGLMMESNGIRILEPFDTSVKYSNASGKTNIHISVSDIFMNLTFSILRLFLAVEEDILTFLRMTSKKITVTCYQFDKVGTVRNLSNDQTFVFWRPRSPRGFAVLGDYLTPMDKPPTKGVIAVNTNFAIVKRPISFKKIWPSSDVTRSSNPFSKGSLSKEDESCSIWFPEAPKGYVAMGCAVSTGRTPPPLSSAFCVLASLVSSCPLRDCITISSTNLCSAPLAFWRVDNSAGSFLPADPVTLNLACRPYELRHIKFGLPESSPKLSEVADAQSSPSEHVDGIQLERPSTATSGRQFEAIASFQLIWWNQASSSTKRLSIWRPIVPEGMVYFGDIAVRGYEPPNSCIVLHDAGDGELFKAPIDFQLVGQIRKQRGVDSISLWMPQPPPGFVSLGCIACKGSPRQHDFCKLRCLRSDMVTGDQFLEESVWDTSDAKFGTGPFSIWTTGNELGTFIVRSGFRKPPKRFALKLADPTAPSGSDDAVIDADLRTISAAIFDDYAGLMVPLFNISLSGIGFSLHGRADYLNSTASFSLAARSYNDKYESWEPLVEPVDGFVRYQYDLNSPGAASQLRLTSTKNLNLNVTVSNANMVTQAYASWNSLSLVNEPHKKSEEFSLTYGARSVVDVHHKKNNYIIPQNKIGQDIFIRATEMGSLSKTIKMPSGDMKPVKVPVSMNMLDSHLEGKLCVQARMMVTVVVVDAQFPNAGGLASNLYTVAIRLTPSQTSGSDPLLHQQSARTSGSVATSSNGLELVNWNEMFFFKVDSLDNCLLELIVTDVGRGTPVGLLSVPVTQISEMYEESFSHLEYMKYLRRIDLSAARSMSIAGGVGQNNSSRSIRCAVLLSSPSEIENSAEGYTVDKKPGFIQISPGMEGPWTTVRLNYAAAAAAWRFGNDVIASEVSVKDGNRYVNIRSIVSVHNNTNFVLHLCLASKASIESIGSVDNANIAEVQQNDSRVESVEFFEIEKYDPAKGWVGLLNFSDGERHQANFEVELPSGWEWIDDWKVDLSSPTTSDGWVYAPDVDSLKWPESYDPSQSVNYARMRRWNRNRIKAVGDPKSKLHVGILNPGETLPLPLAYLTQTEQYILQLRPLNPDEYSWSYVVDRLGESENSDKSSSLCVSSLIESEELLFCNQTTGSSSGGNRKLWFFVSIQPTEIAKDIRSEPIHDWHIIVKSPLSISNYLPMAAEYSILDILPTGHFVACSRGVFAPGKTVNIHTADIRRSLFLSLRPQKGWIPIHDAVLISQPHGLPSRTMSLRSAISGRIVQLILEQTYEKESPLMEKMIRVYAPYWFSIAKCPLLRCRLVELSGKRHSRKLAKPFQSKKNSEILTGEITEEEIHDGHTIASALNFKLLGLQVAIAQSAEEQHYGPIKDLSSLGDMDGSLDLFAYDADGNCLHLFISTKTCPYQSVPTKVISIRPYMTFTNRLGQDMYIKQSTEDEPKILHAFDSRISYMWRKAHEADKFQFKLEDTEWSYPIQITKEDSIVIVLRRQNNTRTFLKIEIRGFEEGSRFIVVFRLGSSSVPIRIENRTASKSIRIRQTGFSDDSWIRMEPCSTAKFYWEDPYGQKFIDAEIDSGVVNGTWKLDLETNGMSSVEGAELGLQFHVAEMGDLKVATFTDFVGSHMQPEANSVLAAGNGGALHKQGEMQNVNSPMEVIVELGVVGISIVDHRPKELSYLYLERVFVSYSTGYDGGTTSRFKIILGYLQLDNQLPLTLLPVLLAPDHNDHTHQPVFKMTITQRNMNTDGVQVYPYVYIRVTEDVWRLSIHEPIIWAMVDFYGKLHLDRLPQDSTITEVDPEIRIELIDVSEVRLKISLETAPAQRPAGVLGIWSPVLSAVGNAFKIQVHLRRVMHKDRFMRKSSIIPAIGNRIWRDLIHNPLHLIFSVDVLGMTSSTLASLSKGFAELSTDGQFLQLRSKQLGSRRITGVGAGIIHGTEALAQGVAFGVSGVVTKPVESARENGILGLAHGLGRAFLGVIVQPVSGALDFFSLTIDGIGASCSKCLEVFNSKSTSHRIRNPRAIRADAILREYSEREAAGQMVLGLAEASRQFGCTEIFKEPSKFALTDYYEDHFPVPYQRVALVTNKRVMLLQSPAPEKMDKKPSKIMWDVPWEELMALELAKAGFQQPSHVLLHLKHFRRSESFVRVIKCSVEEESEGSEPQAIRICVTIRKMWKAYQSDTKCLALKVPSSQRYVHFAWNESDGKQSYRSSKGIIKSRELSSSSSVLSGRFVKHSMNFQKIWSSEQQPKGRCKLCQKQVEENRICSIWRPICPEGYVSIGDVAHVGVHAPNVAAVYRRIDNMFADPVGYDLVWRNCADDYKSMVSIWHPRAPDGYVSPGCVAVAGFEEPEPNLVSCVAESLTEQTEFEEKVWSAPDAYPWACHVYQIRSDALHFVVLRQRKDDSDWKPMRIIDDPNHRSQTAEAQ